MQIENVDSVVTAANSTILKGSTSASTIDSWVQGAVYTGSGNKGSITKGALTPQNRADVLVDKSKKYFGRNQPQYSDAKVSDFVNAKKDCGAKGDGKADDLAALQPCFDKNTAKIVWIPAGQYIVSDTLKIPAGTKMVSYHCYWYVQC